MLSPSITTSADSSSSHIGPSCLGVECWLALVIESDIWAYKQLCFGGVKTGVELGDADAALSSTWGWFSLPDLRAMRFLETFCFAAAFVVAFAFVVCIVEVAFFFFSFFLEGAMIEIRVRRWWKKFKRVDIQQDGWRFNQTSVCLYSSSNSSYTQKK